MARPMRLGRRTLVALIEQTYAAALNAAAWEPLLLAIAESLAASGTIFLHHDLTRQGGVPVGVRIDPDALRLYNEYYHQLDPWAEGARKLALSDPGSVVSDEMLVPRSHLYRTEYFNDFVSKFGLTRMLSVNLNPDPAAWSGITVIRAQADSSFGEEERRFVRRLTPHLQRALQLHRHVVGNELMVQGSLEAFDRLGHGVLLIDARGRVAHANASADRLLRARNGIMVDHGELKATRDADTRSLRALLAAAVDTTRGDGLGSGGVMTVERFSQGRPLHLLVAPTAKRQPLLLGSSPPLAIVVVTDPERRPLPSAERIGRVLQLTPAEARLTRALLEGWNLHQSAAQLGVSVGTARTRLKTIFAKTQTHRQSELIQLTLASVPADL